MHNILVKDLMTKDVITLQRSESINLAEEVMKLARVRHLPVIDGKKVVGLVTHRDLLRAQMSMFADLSRDERKEIQQGIRVADVMRTQIRTIEPTMTALEAAKVMRRNTYGCLPVVEDGVLVGILTEADFIELVIRALEGNSN